MRNLSLVFTLLFFALASFCAEMGELNFNQFRETLLKISNESGKGEISASILNELFLAERQFSHDEIMLLKFGLNKINRAVNFRLNAEIQNIKEYLDKKPEKLLSAYEFIASLIISADSDPDLTKMRKNLARIHQELGLLKTGSL